MQRWKLEGTGVEVLCVHKQLLLVLRMLTVRRLLPLGDWLEREDTNQYEGIDEDIISVVPESS